MQSSALTVWFALLYATLFVSAMSAPLSEKSKRIIEELAYDEIELQELDKAQSHNKTAAVSACGKHSGCLSCVNENIAKCGWCGTGNSGSCVEVGKNTTNAKCDSWDVGYCAQETCSEYMSCDMCSKDPRCGWCGQGAHGKGKHLKGTKESKMPFCIEGSSDGPHKGFSCAKNQWLHSTCSQKPMELYESSVGVQQSSHEDVSNFWPSTFDGIRSSSKLKTTSTKDRPVKSKDMAVRTMDLEESPRGKTHLEPFKHVKTHLESFHGHKHHDHRGHHPHHYHEQHERHVRPSHVPIPEMMNFHEEKGAFPSTIEGEMNGKKVVMHMATEEKGSLGKGGAHVEILGEKKKSEARKKHDDSNGGGNQSSGSFHAVKMAEDKSEEKHRHHRRNFRHHRHHRENRHGNHGHEDMGERRHARHSSHRHSSHQVSSDNGSASDEAETSKSMEVSNMPGFEGFVSPADWDKAQKSDGAGSTTTEAESNEQVEKAPEVIAAQPTSSSDTSDKDSAKPTGANVSSDAKVAKDGAMLGEKKASVAATPETVDSKISNLKAELASLEKEKAKTDAVEAALMTQNSSSFPGNEQNQASVPSVSAQESSNPTVATHSAKAEDTVPAADVHAQTNVATARKTGNARVVAGASTAGDAPSPAGAATTGVKTRKPATNGFVSRGNTDGMGIHFHDTSNLVNGSPLDGGDVSSPVMPPDLDLKQ